MSKDSNGKELNAGDIVAITIHYKVDELRPNGEIYAGKVIGGPPERIEFVRHDPSAEMIPEVFNFAP
jgi:hypothetical protein